MLQDAIKRFPSKSAFCRAIGMKPQFLWQILSDLRPLPPRYCIPIEEVTGGAVTRYELRPDIFGVGPDPDGKRAAKRP